MLLDAIPDSKTSGLVSSTAVRILCSGPHRDWIHPLFDWYQRQKRSKAALKRIKKLFTTVRFVSSLRFSESYLSFKGAALILPQSECVRRRSTCGQAADIQVHLQSMFYLLRPQDTIKVAVKLESTYPARNRYLAVVSTVGVQDTEESVLLGADIGPDAATIGLVLPVWADMQLNLDGDGGFTVTSNHSHHVFKPVSVKVMWSALQSLIKVRDSARENNYYPMGLTHTWVQYYKVTSEQSCINEWNLMEDLETVRQESAVDVDSLKKDHVERLIKTKLKEIMMTVDLEEVTSKYLRVRLEEDLSLSLIDFKHFIDEEMIVILRQMDSPSQIFDHLYLGSEWNASNLDELKNNRIGYILNVTREIDNFFPGYFQYYNIRVYDVEQAELLKHWDNTFKFITRAKKNHSRVLVHCKMGVSRSASTVMAYAMKEYGWTEQQAYDHVKAKRSCVKPNGGFLQQLITYEGILDASKQRHNTLWRSASAGDLLAAEPRPMGHRLTVGRPGGGEGGPLDSHPSSQAGDLALAVAHGGSAPGLVRHMSWSPHGGSHRLMMNAHGMASEGDTSEEDPFPYNPDLDPDPDFDAASGTATGVADWEELDASSRSAHSLDELFLPPDSPEGTSSRKDKLEPEWRGEGAGGGGVVLLSHRPLPDDRPDSPLTPHSEDSDPEDFAAEEMPTSRERYGAYDVTMLTGCEETAPGASAAGGGGGGDDCEEPEALQEVGRYFLHPDVRMEYMLAQDRKRRRIARMVRWSQAQLASDTDASGSAAPPRVVLSDAASAGQTPCSVKLKPDNFWIKEDAMDAETSSDEDVSRDSSDVVGKKATDEEDSTSIEERPKFNIGDSDESADKTHSSYTLSPDGAPPTDAVKSDMNAKEEVTLSPGSVRRTTMEMEEKMRTEMTLKEIQDKVRTMSGSSGSESGSSGHSAERLLLTIAHDVILRDSGAAAAGTHSGTDAVNQPSANAGDSGTAMLEVAMTTAGLPRPVSQIYQAEDIQLEPGIVLKTKREIEQRDRSGSFGELSRDSTSVQRSASLKESRVSPLKAKDRDSERRKTCLPVLTPSPSRETLTQADPDTGTGTGTDTGRPGDPQTAASLAATLVAYLTANPDLGSDKGGGGGGGGGGGEVDGTEGEAVAVAGHVRVYRVGSEDVEVKDGQVKRRTKDFEELTREEQQTLQSLALVPPAADRERSRSPFIEEEGLQIKRGSVRRRTHKIEKKYGAPPGEGEDEEENGEEEEEEAEGEGEGDPRVPEGQGGVTPPPLVCLTPCEDTCDQVKVTPTEEEKAESDEGTKTGSGSGGPSSGTSPGKSGSPGGRGCLAYPEEEDIPWSLGTVRQHLEAIESKARADFRMSGETLRLIRQVGSELLEAPRAGGDTTRPACPMGVGVVRRVARRIETLSSEAESESTKATSSVARSASLKEPARSRTLEEISPTKELGRSASLGKKEHLVTSLAEPSPSPSPKDPDEASGTGELSRRPSGPAARGELLKLSDNTGASGSVSDATPEHSSSVGGAGDVAEAQSSDPAGEVRKYRELRQMFESGGNSMEEADAESLATSPGNTATSPGKTVTSPGKTATSPVKTVTSPGKTATSPVKTATSMGKSTLSPGKTTLSPGKSGTSPSQLSIWPDASPLKMTPLSDMTSTSLDKTSISPSTTSTSPGTTSTSLGLSALSDLFPLEGSPTTKPGAPVARSTSAQSVEAGDPASGVRPKASPSSLRQAKGGSSPFTSTASKIGGTKPAESKVVATPSAQRLHPDRERDRPGQKSPSDRKRSPLRSLSLRSGASGSPSASSASASASSASASSASASSTPGDKLLSSRAKPAPGDGGGGAKSGKAKAGFAGGASGSSRGAAARGLRGGQAGAATGGAPRAAVNAKSREPTSVTSSASVAASAATKASVSASVTSSAVTKTSLSASVTSSAAAKTSTSVAASAATKASVSASVTSSAATKTSMSASVTACPPATVTATVTTSGPSRQATGPRGAEKHTPTSSSSSTRKAGGLAKGGAGAGGGGGNSSAVRRHKSFGHAQDVPAQSIKFSVGAASGWPASGSPPSASPLGSVLRDKSSRLQASRSRNNSATGSQGTPHRDSDVISGQTAVPPVDPSAVASKSRASLPANLDHSALMEQFSKLHDCNFAELAASLNLDLSNLPKDVATSGLASASGSERTVPPAVTTPSGGELKSLCTPAIPQSHIPMSPDQEPAPDSGPRKLRKLHGKSHPLSRLGAEQEPRGGAGGPQLTGGRTANPFYNTM